jgi:hypothetical protein
MTLPLLALAALAAVPGCDGAQEIICVGRVEVGADGKTRCFGTVPPQPDAVVTPQPDVVVTPQPDVVEATPDVVVEVDAAPDPEQQCAADLRGKKPLMAGCEKHCECKTGFCYDEGAYLGGFRFCTRPCDGGCTNEASGSIQTTVCLILAGQALAEAHPEIQTPYLCAATCKNLEDCKQLSSAYDTCGSPASQCGGGAITCWGNTTLAAQKTCQITSTVQ